MKFEINEIPENYEEKQLKRENDSCFCEMIQNDNIESFTVYYTKEGISPSKIIDPSIYKTISFLENKTQSLIESDSVVEFISYINRTNLSLLTKVKPSVYETDSF